MKILAAAIVLLLQSPVSLFARQSSPIQLHPKNPHYFLYKNKPTVLIGSGEHYGAVINLDFDYKRYLQTMGHEGLNTTRLFTGAYIEKQGDFGIAKNTLAALEGRLLLPWRRSNVKGFALGRNKFDLNSWDEEYFVRLKDFIEEANRYNIIVEVNLFSSHYGNGWDYSALNAKNNINSTDTITSNKVNTLENGNILNYQKKYVQKIVQELNGFDNVYFEIQNEPWADQTDTVIIRNEYSDAKEWRSAIQVVSRLSNNWQREVAKWIKDAERTLPKKHLISQNISNFRYPVANPDPNISIFNFHYSLPEAVSENYHLNRVIGFNETGFAGRADHTYRRQAWRFMMAGGGLFNQLDYSFSVGSENGTDTGYAAPGGGSPDLRKQFVVLKKFIETLDFINLYPDKIVVKASPAAFTEAMSYKKSSWVIYYEPLDAQPENIILDLPTGNYIAEWINVITGKIIEKRPLVNGKVSVPPGKEDKVLVISRAKAVKKKNKRSY